MASEWEALRLKGLAIGTLCILAADVAQAGSLQVAGSAGYASEWTLEGEVTQIGTTQQYAGPVAFTHAGLCTVSGPPVRSSQIKFEISRSGIIIQDPGNHFVRRGLVRIRWQALGLVISWVHALF